MGFYTNLTPGILLPRPHGIPKATMFPGSQRKQPRCQPAAFHSGGMKDIVHQHQEPRSSRDRPADADRPGVNAPEAQGHSCVFINGLASMRSECGHIPVADRGHPSPRADGKRIGICAFAVPRFRDRSQIAFTIWLRWFAPPARDSHLVKCHHLPAAGRYASGWPHLATYEFRNVHRQRRTPRTRRDSLPDNRSSIRSWAARWCRSASNGPGSHR